MKSFIFFKSIKYEKKLFLFTIPTRQKHGTIFVPIKLNGFELMTSRCEMIHHPSVLQIKSKIYMGMYMKEDNGAENEVDNFLDVSTLKTVRQVLDDILNKLTVICAKVMLRLM